MYGSFESRLRRAIAAGVVALSIVAIAPGAQQHRSGARALPPPVKFTGDGDHQNMMEQLGITALRPGADPKNPNTFDEAGANPYPLPDLMTMKNGRKVTTPRQWNARRLEIAEDFEREVYGRIPPNVPKVTWEVTSTTPGEIAHIATVTKTLVGHVDNSSYPFITVDIQASLTTPANASGPVPVMVELSWAFGRGPKVWPWQELLIAKGWGYASIVPTSIQADGPELTSGIIGLTNKGQPRKPDDWGALRAWQWGVSRLIDYFETDKAVDAKQIGVEGLSRYGKAALVTEAFEPRIAVGFIGSSGEGGAKLHRHIFGEAVENLTGGEYYWMAGNFMKYGASEAAFGPKTAGDIPVDSHELIALCAPRPCFISYGTIEGGDPQWVDAHGSFMAAVAAGPAYRLLGKRDLGTPGDYLTDPMPPVGQLIGGELAWRQHSGGHSVAENWPAFVEWASEFIHGPPAPAPAPTFTPYHQSGIYGVGETVGWTAEAPSGRYDYVVRKDDMVEIASGSLDLSTGPGKIEIKLDEPAMVFVEFSENGKKREELALGAAVAPEKLEPSVPRPDDFDSFWQSKIELLGTVPEHLVLSPSDSGRPDVDYATFRMDNFDGSHIYGQMAKPKKPGKYPALVILQWASPPYPLQKQWVTDRAAKGWLTINVEPHDVLPTEPKAYYDALPDRLKHYESIERENRDRNYFLRMYLGDYRAIEYIASRPDWDGKTLVLLGTSMGGQQSLCLAGLNTKVTHMIVNEPSGCDTNGPLHGRASGYPFWPADNPKAMEVSRYFDPVNFASRITATSLVAMGFVDPVAPPVGIWIAFNQIKGPKEAAPMPESPHNNMATPEEQRPFTSRSEEWLDTLVQGKKIVPKSL